MGNAGGQCLPVGDVIGGGDANYYVSGDPFEVGTTPVGYYGGGQVPVGEDRANDYGLHGHGG